MRWNGVRGELVVIVCASSAILLRRQRAAEAGYMSQDPAEAGNPHFSYDDLCDWT